MGLVHDLIQDNEGRWFFTDKSRSFYATLEEALMSEQHEQYVAQVKQANQQVWDGINRLLALQRQWNALDYGNTLSVQGVVTAEVGAVVFDSANALKGVLDAGNATNMAKLL